MKEALPVISLREPEKIWLQYICEATKARNELRYPDIKIALGNKIPSNFQPRTIDERLVYNNGSSPSLLGMMYGDPQGDWLIKTDHVIHAMRDAIVENTKINSISAEQIAEKTHLALNDVVVVLGLIIDYAGFWRSSGSGDISVKTIYFDNLDNNTFDLYYNYPGAENLLKAYYEEFAQQKRIEQFQDIVQEIPEKSYRGLAPVFSSSITTVDPRMCFVLMPFGLEWSKRVYEKYIRHNMEAMEFQCMRADNDHGPIIIEDIWIKINQAGFIIADVTDKNPNVMYELGIAHTLGKPTILITQKMNEIPFDFKHLRHYEYQDHVDGLEEFSLKIKTVMKELAWKYYSLQMEVHAQD